MSEKFISTTCPHCRTDRVAFYFQGEVRHPNNNEYTSFWTCGNCFKGIGATSKSSIQIQGAGNFNAFLADIYPEIDEITAPKYTPTNIADHYKTAKFNLVAEKFYAAAVMARTAIETAIDELGATGNSLFEKINALAKAQTISPSLAEWAHEVRIIGKTAAHNLGNIDGNDAADAVAFAEMFFMYTFTLPGMIAERRQRQ
jgi:hypothetical protein